MNSPYSVESIVPEVAAATQTVRDCEKELYCGFPYLMPVTTFLWYILKSAYYSIINAQTEKALFTGKRAGYPDPLRS